jgi:hypothetical protein
MGGGDVIRIKRYYGLVKQYVGQDAEYPGRKFS